MAQPPALRGKPSKAEPEWFGLCCCIILVILYILDIFPK